jgi:hypothetical protein
MRGDKRLLVVFVGTISALMLTHQVSLFISAILVIAISLAIIVYTLHIPAKVAHISMFTGFAVVLDFMVTGYRGPEGSESFFQRVLGAFVESLMVAETDARSEVAFPADSAISSGGAAAMANIQLLGSTLLLFFAILGVLFWIHNSNGSNSIFVALCLGVGITILLVLTLGFPLVGMRNLIPSRWWPFTYILLAVFAAPGLIFLTQRVGSIFPRSNVIIFFIFFSVLIPYVVLMGGAAAASADNPFINDGFSAVRYSITDTEQALGEHMNRYDSESIRSVSDTHYPYASGTVYMAYNDPQSLASKEPILIANRAYISKKQAMYILQVEDSTITVHGGVPIEKLKSNYKSTLYDNGKEELLWVQIR